MHWGPRTLDLDILLYGDRQVNQKNLIIPHIDMCNRSFVLQPLMQIAPGMVHPIRRRTIYDLYHMLQK
jgi:2-amino-4-hydroxy-6-hydroxymethyldihydropteridine diphosphokinase